MNDVQTEFPSSLKEMRAILAAAFHLPDNYGIRFRALNLWGTEMLCVLVDGLADADLAQKRLLGPLQQAAMSAAEIHTTAPEALANILPATSVRIEMSLSEVVRGVLDGETALLVDGHRKAILVDTADFAVRPQGGVAVDRRREVFGTRLLENVALVRKRLRLPDLVAHPVPIPAERGTLVVLYVDGIADKDLISRVHRWALDHGSEAGLRRGAAAGTAGKFGLIPTYLQEEWPDKIAVLLREGYVAIMADRLPVAYMAPVTLPAVLHNPGDETLWRPLASIMKTFRIFLYFLVALLPGYVTAILTFHQEMLPTPLLLTIAAGRENRPFPVGFEMLAVMALQEALREAAVRLPVAVHLGPVLIADFLLLGFLLFVGFIGPVIALTTVVVAVSSIAMSNYNLGYSARLWRAWMVIPAAILGAYGVAVAGFLLMAYLFWATSFETPFVGESAGRFDSHPTSQR